MERIETPTTYYVWRRLEERPERAHLHGYVDATCYDPNFAPGKGPGESFEILLITENWDGEAKPLIQRERSAA